MVKGIRRRFVFEAPFSKWEGKKKNSSVTVESFLKLRSEMARSRFSDYIEKVKLRPFCRFIVHSTNFCQNAHSWSSLLNTVSSKSHWWNVRFLHVAEETAVLCVTPKWDLVLRTRQLTWKHQTNLGSVLYAALWCDENTPFSPHPLSKQRCDVWWFQTQKFLLYADKYRVSQKIWHAGQ